MSVVWRTVVVAIVITPGFKDLIELCVGVSKNCSDISPLCARSTPPLSIVDNLGCGLVVNIFVDVVVDIDIDVVDCDEDSLSLAINDVVIDFILDMNDFAVIIKGISVLELALVVSGVCDTPPNPPLLWRVCLFITA